MPRGGNCVAAHPCDRVGSRPRCLAVDAVAVEIARHVPRLAEKRKLDPAVLLEALQVMPIEWKDFRTAGVDVVTTGELLDLLWAAGHDLR
jgi:hypothetical protein